MRRATIVALLGLLLASCGGGGNSGVSDRPASPGSAGAVPVDSLPPLVPITADGIHAAAAAPGARATLVNVWASWCAPCRVEFPDLMRVGREYEDRGLKLLLVSVDFPDQEQAALSFLAGQGASFQSYIQAGDVMNFINTLNPEWTGAIPASFVYDAGGRLVAFHEGMARYEDFRRMVLPLLEAPATETSGG